MIVAVSPGGSNDVVARLVAGKLTERLREQVVVVNRAGAGGLIGYEAGARATRTATRSFSPRPLMRRSPQRGIRHMIR